jgi:hypothetical protein
MCPTDGSTCGNCIASNCCAQAATCLTDPACVGELQCLVKCVLAGGGPIMCFQQCGANPQVLQAALCTQQNCGTGICL